MTENLYRQLVRYGIVGVFLAALDTGIFFILTHYRINQYYSNLIAMNTGLVLGFFLNRHFTFGVKNKKVLRFSAYVLLGYSSQGISTLLLYLLTMRLSPGLSKIISVLCIAVYNFTVCRLLIFKDKQT